MVTYDETGGIVTIALNRPQRHNALVPELLDALNAALERAAHASPVALVLRGAGRSFSSGGDVRRFYDASRSQRREYALSALFLREKPMQKNAPTVIRRTLDTDHPPQITAEQKQRLVAIAAMLDANIDYSDAPYLPDAVWIRQEALDARRSGTR